MNWVFASPAREYGVFGLQHLRIYPSGKRVRRSTGTTNKKAAQELHDRLKAELWRLEKLGEEPERSFEEAAIRFLQASEGQRDYNTKIRHVRYWQPSIVLG